MKKITLETKTTTITFDGMLYIHMHSDGIIYATKDSNEYVYDNFRGIITVGTLEYIYSMIKCNLKFT